MVEGISVSTRQRMKGKRQCTHDLVVADVEFSQIPQFADCSR